MSVRCCDRHCDELRAHCLEHPLQHSRVAVQQERGEADNTHTRLPLLVLPAWLELNCDWNVDSGLPIRGLLSESMESYLNVVRCCENGDRKRSRLRYQLYIIFD